MHSWEAEVDKVYMATFAAEGREIPEVAAAVREFSPMMLRANNATMMLGLDTIVSARDDAIPASLRSYMIAEIRQRHMTMPMGREISDQMQNALERGLMQARMHLTQNPTATGARDEFRVAANQYFLGLNERQELAGMHLEKLEQDTALPASAVEWCERLVTKFTPQEIARPELPDYAHRLERATARFLETEGVVAGVLASTIDMLELGTEVTSNATEGVRESVPHLAAAIPHVETSARKAVPAAVFQTRMRLTG